MLAIMADVENALSAHYGVLGVRSTGLMFEHGDIVGAGGLAVKSHHHHGKPRLHTKKNREAHWRRRMLRKVNHLKRKERNEEGKEGGEQTPLHLPAEVYMLVTSLDQDPFNETLLKKLDSMMTNHPSTSHLHVGTFSLGVVSLFNDIDRLLKKLADDVDEVRLVQEEIEEQEAPEEGEEQKKKRDSVHTADAWRPTVRALVSSVHSSVVSGSELDDEIAKQIWSVSVNQANELSSLISQTRLRNAAIDVLGGMATPGAQRVLLSPDQCPGLEVLSGL